MEAEVDWGMSLCIVSKSSLELEPQINKACDEVTDFPKPV